MKLKIRYLLAFLAFFALFSGNANAAVFMGTAPDLSSLATAVNEFDVSTIFDVMKTVFGFLIGIRVFKMGGHTILSVLGAK